MKARRERGPTRTERELILICDCVTQQDDCGPWTVRLPGAEFDRLFSGLRSAWRFRVRSIQSTHFSFHGVLFERNSAA